MSTTAESKQRHTTREAKARPAEIVREYGPFPGADKVNGVSHDGRHVWFAGGAQLIAFEPATGKVARTRLSEAWTGEGYAAGTAAPTWRRAAVA